MTSTPKQARTHHEGQKQNEANDAVRIQSGQTKTVTLPDGSVTPYVLYPSVDADASRGIVIIWPGFGMGARYFRPIAEELSQRGFSVLAAELRGQGEQTAVAKEGYGWGYPDLVNEDYRTAVDVSRETFGDDLPVYFLCHSLGGQVATLYAALAVEQTNYDKRSAVGEVTGPSDAAATTDPAAAIDSATATGATDTAKHNTDPVISPLPEVDGIFCVGSGEPHHIHFTGKIRTRLRIGARLMPLVAKYLGYWPDGKFDIAGYGRQPKPLITQWGRFGRTGQWFVDPAPDAMSNSATGSVNNSLVASESCQEQASEDIQSVITIPVLFLTCAGDEDCPLPSAQALAKRYPGGAPVEFIDEPLGHNRWARQPKTIADRFEAFVAAHTTK